ncbi:MAG: tetratricopeptide repeat protein [Planctomycetota bacterium]
MPTWCRWGFYSWPAYCSYYWPRYSWWSYGSTAWTGYYWSQWDPYGVATYRPWYWPTSVYVPVSVPYGDYGDDDADVTIRIDDGRADIVSTSGAVRVRRGGAEAAPSKEDLAERHVTLADGYFSDGRYQDAADSYLRALSYLPDDASIHFALSDALFALGDYHYAAFMISKALQLDPELATVVVDKRTFYGKPEELDAQIETLKRYTEEKPYDAAAQLVLGYNLRFSGDGPGAERAFRRVLEIDEHNEAAELFLAAMRAKSSSPAATEREKSDK